MWTKALYWVHHIFNPHCPHCEERARLKEHCKNCEVLEEQLDFTNREKMKLLDTIIELSNPTKKEEIVENKEYKPVHSGVKFKPWGAMRQELEKKERERSEQILRDRNKELNPEIEKLEELVLEDEDVRI